MLTLAGGSSRHYQPGPRSLRATRTARSLSASGGAAHDVYARGDWAVVVNPVERIIITVLYRDHTRWLTTDRAGIDEHAHAC